MGPVQPSERLWRSVFRDRQARAVKLKRSNHFGKQVFVEESPGAGISVDRFDHVSLAFAAAEGDRKAQSVKGARGVLGWATITGETACGMDRKVQHTPTEGYIYHADIFLPEVDQDGWEDHEAHAIDLLVHSEWMEREGPLPAIAASQ